MRLMRVRQRSASRKKKGSSQRKKAYGKVARLHQKIVHRRNAHQWETAKKIAKKADCIAIENLNVKGMMGRCKTKQDEKTGRFLPNGQSAKKGQNPPWCAGE